MTEPWPIYLVVFALIFVATLLFQGGASTLALRKRRKRSRLDSITPPGSGEEIEIVRRRRSRIGEIGLVQRLDRFVLQSGTQLSPVSLAAIWLGLALACLVLLPSFTNGLRLPSALLAGALLLGLWLWRKRARRMARFGEQLPEVLDIIVRSLRAGHPLPVSLSLVAREIPAPAGPEFATVVDEITYGRSVTQALENLYERVAYPELKFFVASASIAQQTGGNLGEILSRLSRLLRERFRLTRRARALSAEGRFSGLALSIMPIALFALINLASPGYYADFWRSDVATRILALCIGLLLVGNLVIYRLVNLKA